MWDFADVYKKEQFAFSYCTIHEWMYKKIEGRHIKDFFEWNNYQNFAIYSLNSLGLMFLEEVRKEELEPAYVIDKREQYFSGKLNANVISPEKIPIPVDVDIIIICHVYYYNEIADYLVGLGIPETKLVSLNDIIFSI